MGSTWIVSDQLPVDKIIQAQPANLELTHSNAAGIKRILLACTKTQEWQLESLSVETSQFFDLTDALVDLIKAKTTLKTVAIGKHCLENAESVLTNASKSKSLKKLTIDLFDFDTEETATTLAKLPNTYQLALKCESKSKEAQALTTLFNEHKFKGRCTQATLPTLLAFANKIQVLQIEAPFMETCENIRTSKSAGTIKKTFSRTMSKGRTLTRSMTTRSMLPLGMTENHPGTTYPPKSRKRKRAADVFETNAKKPKNESHATLQQQAESLADTIRRELKEQIDNETDSNKKLGLWASLSLINAPPKSDDAILKLSKTLPAFKSITRAIISFKRAQYC